MTDQQYQYISGAGAPIKAWTRGVPLADNASEQIRNTASLPFIHKHVAVMPDAHWGMGATVGTVIATKGAIVPAAVGVDIGCGMMAVQTSITASDLPDNLQALRTAIEAAVPHGRTNDGKQGDRGAWGERVGDPHVPGVGTLQYLKERHPKLFNRREPVGYAAAHLGTLGTGNHFIEVCLDEQGQVWIMLHSGSRGIGNRIGRYFIEAAKKDMQRWFINLPDADLAYIPQGSDVFKDYLTAVEWGQEFALENRRRMMNATWDALETTLKIGIIARETAVNCHHNYVAWENHFGDNVLVTRKGAVRARDGDLGIIPGNMGERSFIVRGLGNAESFHSCSHGAGRVMSRTEARKMITHSQHIRDTEGVECRKDEGVIDESPAAYKDLDAVMAAQSDLVEIVTTLKQVLCVKG